MAWRHPSWNCFLGPPLGVSCGLEWEGGKRGVSWDGEELGEPPSEPPVGASGPWAGQMLQENPDVALVPSGAPH